MADIIETTRVNNSSFEILTPSGFRPFAGVLRGLNDNKVRIECMRGEVLVCTPKHKLVDINYDVLYADDITPGTQLLGGQTVERVSIYTSNELMYEVLDVDNGHLYLTNGFISKNCLIIDEMAHIPNHMMEEFWASVIPIISSTKKRSTKIFAVSCVIPETHVITPTGIKTVEQFIDRTKNQGYHVPTYSVVGKDKINRGDIMFNNGVAETRNITTQSTSLECSTAHKIWSCKSGVYGWHRAEELQVGDYIAIRYGADIWGSNDSCEDFTPTVSPNIRNEFAPKRITPDLAYFLGLYLSEGSVYKVFNEAGKLVGGTVNIACGDDITEALKVLNIHVSTIDSTVGHAISSLNLVEWLEYLGFDVTKKAPEKIIPPRLLEMSRENIIGLLQGIFDGDGFCSKSIGRVGINLTSKELIYQIRTILMNFGILTHISKVTTPPNELVKVSSTGYRLECCGRASQTFGDKIGFRFSRKRANIKRSTFRNTKDVIPFSKNLVHQSFKRGAITRLSQSGISSAKFYTNVSPHISRDVMLRILQVLPSNMYDADLREFCDTNVATDIKWEPITDIVAGEAEVFDFSLHDDPLDPWCHSVIYNGVVGHQTPNGTGNKFHEIFIRAQSGVDKEWKAEQINWHEVPGRDERWKQDMISALGGDMQMFNQECNCFSGDAIISVRSKETGEEMQIPIRDLYMMGELLQMTVKLNSLYEILTPTGYKDFTGIKKSVQPTITIICDNKVSYTVTSDHLFNMYGENQRAKDLHVGDTIELADQTEACIVDIIDNPAEDVYEPLDVADGALYIVEGVVNHNCVFLESGESAVDMSILSRLKTICKPPVIMFESGSYKIWESPEPGHIYGIGVDVSEGIGRAASVAQILDFTDLTNIRQVACYHNTMVHPIRFAEVLNRIGDQWGRPPMLIERNNCGAEVINTLHEKYGYYNLVSYDPGTQSRKSILLGITSHTNVKYQGVMNLRYWLNTLDCVQVRDIGLVQELETFVRYPNGTWKAKSGGNIFDDRVMSLVWGLFLLQEEICSRYYEIVDYDSTGKPAKLSSYERGENLSFSLDSFYHTEDAPLPSIIGLSPNTGVSTDADFLTQTGWTPLYGNTTTFK